MDQGRCTWAFKRLYVFERRYWREFWWSWFLTNRFGYIIRSMDPVKTWPVDQNRSSNSIGVTTFSLSGLYMYFYVVLKEDMIFIYKRYIDDWRRTHGEYIWTLFNSILNYFEAQHDDHDIFFIMTIHLPPCTFPLLFFFFCVNLQLYRLIHFHVNIFYINPQY